MKYRHFTNNHSGSPPFKFGGAVGGKAYLQHNPFRDFCGTKTLREATREQVEAFVAHLADWAEKDRNALLCQLNSYPINKEGAA